VSLLRNLYNVKILLLSLCGEVSLVGFSGLTYCKVRSAYLVIISRELICTHCMSKSEFISIVFTPVGRISYERK